MQGPFCNPIAHYHKLISAVHTPTAPSTVTPLPAAGADADAAGAPRHGTVVLPKDPALEAALRRNRRWIVNNKIKRFLLRFPSRTAPVRLLQSRFKTLDLLGRAANWLRKYPSCFDLFDGGGGDGDGDGGEAAFFGFTKRMAALVDAEEAAVAASEPAMADRLARVLMLARGLRLQVSKLAAFRGSLGLPDDYLLRLLPGRTDLFRLANPYPHRRNAAELELLRWVPSLAVSSVEAAANASSYAPRFTCSLPHSWAKSRAKMEEFNSTPYISPYSEKWAVIGTDADAEKRAVAVVHELLLLTLWKKTSVLKLEHFRREFGLPEDTARMLHRHPCLFYVSNSYKIHTVVLREGHEGSELREKDPVVAAKDRLGELMQEGLHEYNQRRRAENLEKKRRRGEIEIKEEKEDDEAAARLDSAEKREERRKFYKVLFNDDNR